MLTAPRKLAHGPLLDQAVVASVVSSVAIIRQRRRRAWCRGGSCRRAALARSPAAEGLLAFGPALLPVREARVAVVWARSGHGGRGRRGRRGWHGGAADVVVSAAPNL